MSADGLATALGRRRKGAGKSLTLNNCWQSRSAPTAEQLHERRDRQPDDVQIVALDRARRAAAPRPWIAYAAGAVAPLARCPGTSRSAASSSARNLDQRRRPPRVRVRPASIRHTPLITACGGPRAPRSVSRASARVRRLAVDPAAERDDRVDAEHDRVGRAARRRPTPCDRRSRSRPRPAAPARAPRRRPAATSNVTPRRAQDRAPLRRARGEDQARSGKNSATSRAADCGESEPWTMFWPTSIA